LIYIVSLSAFFIGYFTANLAADSIIQKHKDKHISESAAPQPSPDKKKIHKTLLHISYLLMLIYALMLAYKYCLLISRFGNPFTQLKTIRQMIIDGKFSFPFFLSLMTLAANIAVLNLGAVFALKNTRRLKTALLILIMFVLLILNDLSTGSRTCPRYVIMLLAAIFLGYTSLGKSIRWKHVVYAAVCCAVLMLALGAVVYLRTAGDVELVEGILISSIYTNIAGNIPAFAYFIDHKWTPILPGYYTFRGIYVKADTVWQMLTGKSFLPAIAYDHYNPDLYANVGQGLLFNTTNDLTSIYMDFGNTGIPIYSYLVGFTAAVLFIKVKIYRRVLDIQLCTMIITAIVMNTRGSYFMAAGFWITLLLIILQNRKIFQLRKYNK